MLTVGSLFSGIGGFDLGLERAGFEIKWQVEIDKYCRKVLTKHWPTVSKYKDIRDCGAHNLEPVDLICGGFPCQPFSNAGKRKGKEDDRYLWKPKVTTQGRLLFQLAPSTPRTGGTGSGFWPTVTAAAEAPNLSSNKKNGPKSLLEVARKMVPTPSSMPRGAHKGREVIGSSTVSNTTGTRWGMTLETCAKMFPTPTANEDACGKSGSKMQVMLGNHPSVKGDGSNGALNPQWVEWLMGYPEGWTDLKDLETP